MSEGRVTTPNSLCNRCHEEARQWCPHDIEGRVSCHCGRTADGHLDGFCRECSDVRCDAYPGACTPGRVSS